MAQRFDQRAIEVSFSELKEALGITEYEDIEDVEAGIVRQTIGGKTFGTVTILLRKRPVTGNG